MLEFRKRLSYVPVRTSPVRWAPHCCVIVAKDFPPDRHIFIYATRYQGRINLMATAWSAAACVCLIALLQIAQTAELPQGDRSGAFIGYTEEHPGGCADRLGGVGPC